MSDINVNLNTNEPQSNFQKISKKITSVDKTLATKLQQITTSVVKASNSLPKIGDGYELYSTYSDYAKYMEQQKLRIILAMRKLLANIGCRVKVTTFSLEDMEKIIFANDFLIEKIGISLDEHQKLLTQELINKSKINTGAEIISSNLNNGKKSIGYKDGGGRYSLILGKKTDALSFNFSSVSLVTANFKPQKSFQDSIVNSDLPFVPKLVIKHNAIKAFQKKNFRLIDENLSQNISKLNSYNSFTSNENWMTEDSLNEHPYLSELQSFVTPFEQLIAPSSIKEVIDLKNTPLKIIDTKNELESLINILNNVKEFAFDVEHHSLRSFLGLTCLIQISTSYLDFIVDPFPIWKHMYLLNEPFSNSKILKILHGGSSDVIWLQRDFGIYVINIFDTSIAMKELGMQKINLKQLLYDLHGVELNKDFQRADWRIRPLPLDFITYARMDSHYLLNCYDQLRIKLAKKELGKNYEGKVSSNIKSVFSICSQLSFKVFEQPRFLEYGFEEILCSRRFNNRQCYVLKQLWKWRDTNARKHDESLHYVLPNHMMLQIAEVLPKEMQGIIACCSPVPPLLKNDIIIIFKFITAARNMKLKLFSEIESNSVLNNLPNNANNFNIISDFMLESNRITKFKAKLEYNFDYTHFKADENIPCIKERLNTLQLSSEKIEIKDNKEIPLILEINEKKFENVKLPKAKQIYNKISYWSTPYDSYLASQVKKKNEQ